MLAKLVNYSTTRKLIQRKFGTSIAILNKKHKSNVEIPKVPLICCGSGCSNCIWIQYAEDLVKYYESLGEKKEKALQDALSKIEKIEDVNLRDFLTMEIKFKLK